jgi:hypothetical protein
MTRSHRAPSAPSLLQRMVIQSSADDVPLQEDGPAESPTLLQYHSRCFSVFYVGTHVFKSWSDFTTLQENIGNELLMSHFMRIQSQMST